MALGAAIVGFGVRGALLHLRPARIVNLSLFLGASGVAHDFLWAPLLVAGGVATRIVPLPFRRPARVGLALSASLVLFAVPLLAGPSTRVRNATVLPLDYTRNLVVTIAVITAVSATVGAAAWARTHRHGTPQS